MKYSIIINDKMNYIKLLENRKVSLYNMSKKKTTKIFYIGKKLD